MPAIGRGASGRNRVGSLLPGLVVAAILVLTLWPLGPRPAFDDDRLSVRFGLADAVRNVLLFVPLGIALARRGRGLAAVALSAALLSGAIELAQVVIPGRYGNLADLVSNATGALLGAALARTAPGWLRPGRRAAARLALAWSAFLATVLLGTGLLLAPSLPASDYYAGWTLDLGHLARYTGRVEVATLGDETLANGRLAHSEQVRRLWLEGAPLRVEATAGTRTVSLAPIFSIHDGVHREILLLGAERGDLVLRVRTRAQAVSLDRPGLRWTGILEDVRPGDRLTIGARREGNGWCLSLGDRSACPLGFSVGSGWRLVWYPHSLPAAAGPWLSAAWLAALFLPLGLWLRADARSLLAVSIATGALLAAPRTGLLPAPPAELAACVAGLALGAALRRR